MAKTYVLDTNVLIQAPYAMQCFEDNHVVIPLVVVEELDGLKKADGERGFNARQAIRFLERLRLRGNLLDGVLLDHGGTLRIEINCVHEALPDSLPDDQADNRILKVCRHLQSCQPILVTKDLVLRLTYSRVTPYGIKPRNAGQYFMQEALMQPASEAPLVIVKGQAGTAKTFYSLAVGLEKIINHPTGEYRRILICRPNAQFDSDIGFLPGDEQEKISPLMRPIIDNLEQLIDSNEDERYDNERELAEKIEEIFDRQLIQTEALNFIRGRSLEKTYLIIDEAQNMTPNQVKGIITRAGKGTKIILVGDPNQIDKPFLDERTNGLTYAAGKMKGSPLCYQLTMMADECERSPLALDAIQRL